MQPTERKAIVRIVGVSLEVRGRNKIVPSGCYCAFVLDRLSVNISLVGLVEVAARQTDTRNKKILAGQEGHGQTVPWTVSPRCWRYPRLTGVG